MPGSTIRAASPALFGAAALFYGAHAAVLPTKAGLGPHKKAPAGNQYAGCRQA